MKDAHDAVECVKQVYENIPDDYTIIFLADHGGHDRTHGTEMPEDMTIPLFFMGPRFEKGKVLPEGSIKDVAPTVAALLECEPAEEWEGTSRV
jgi:phosphopentomutase